MRHYTNEEREELLDAVRRAVRERVAPRAVEIDRAGQFPDDIRRLWAEMGLLGLSVPEDFGGAGMPLEVTVDIVIEIAKTCANSANIVTQQDLATSPILSWGTVAQRRRWLPELASGEHLAAFALTEPDAGSDNRSMRTIALLEGDDYVVNGAKVFCTWGSIASVMTIFARTTEDPDGDGFVALVVDLPNTGISVDRIEHKMGLHGSPTAQLSFHELRVPVANRLGSVGRGLRIAYEALTPARIEMGALALGIAIGSLEYAGRYLNERVQFGQKLSSFQGLRFRIAEHATRLEAALHLLRAAACAVDRGTDDAVQLSAMAKLFATDTAMEVSMDVVSLLGGYGYMTEYPVERMMRDVKVTQIVEGTNEIQRLIIAREWFLRIDPGMS